MTVEVHVHDDASEAPAEVVGLDEHPHAGCVDCEREREERRRMEQSEQDRLENIRQGNEYMFAEVANRLDRLDEKVTGTLMLQAADISADEVRAEEESHVEPEAPEPEPEPVVEPEPTVESESEPEVIKVESTSSKSKKEKPSRASRSHRWGR